ncbi:permease-like cell division protein FtsX [Actinoplanes sp. NPDC024001]|uniref:permease-like cell division protein FtsX n=1 Tax=Actinoplanes sp. NPDC024001 TaxID=3154598 RepID=UPI0033F70051
MPDRDLEAELLALDTPEAEAERRESPRRWLLLVAVAGAALVIGAVAATSVMIAAGWRYQPDRQFEVAVFLEPGITAEQRSAIRSELTGFPGAGDVRLETRDQALARLREAWKHQPDRVEGIQVETMSESFRLVAVGREFDCGPVPGIRRLPGVERVWIVMHATSSRYGAELGC